MTKYAIKVFWDREKDDFTIVTAMSEHMSLGNKKVAEYSSIQEATEAARGMNLKDFEVIEV